jgi:YD repeat-containing protein
MVTGWSNSLLGEGNYVKLYDIVTLLAVVLTSSSVVCQVTPDMATGLSPYATYIPSDIDNVNPANGNIFLKIPLLGYPQKGGKLRLNYYIFYNDKQWQANLHPDITNGEFGQVSGQWTPAGLSQSYSLPTLSAAGAYVGRDQYVYYAMNYNQSIVQTFGTGSDSYSEQTEYITESATTPDGATHYIGDGFKETVSCGPLVPANACPQTPSWNNGVLIETYPATDASGYDQFGHDPEGIIYGSNTGLQTSNFSNLAVSDPNGNTITASSSSGWTDTYGRVIPGTMSGPGFVQFPNVTGPFTPVSLADLIPGVAAGTVPSQCGGASEARIWTVPASQSYGNGSATYYLCYTYLSFQSAFDLSTVLPTQSTPLSAAEGGSSTGMGQALMLTSVVLPDGNSYTFAYDNYLSLTELGLPSGGTISYTWQNVVFDPYPIISSASYGTTSWSGVPTPVSRALLTRTVTPGNGQPSITESYHWNITTSANHSANGVQFPAYSVVTDSNLNDTEYTLGGTDDAGNFWSGYVVTGVASYTGCSPHDANCTGGTGTRLKSVTYALTATGSGGASPNSPAFVPQLFTLPPTKVIQTTTHLPSTGGDMLSMVKNTMVPSYGTSSNCTVYLYPVFGSLSAPTLPTQDYPPCWSTGQFASTSTYDLGSSGSGTVGPLLKTESTPYVWQSTSTYLQANLLDLVNKDVITNGNGSWVAETDYGYDASPSPPGARGNQTSVSRYKSSASALTSTVQYNSNGIVALTADPNSNKTSYSNFLCDGALPQTVTKAYSSPTTTPETTTYSYDCNTGKVLTVQDPNLKTTTFTYSDPLGRVKTAGYPDGGGASVTYSDVTSPNSFPLTMTETTLTGESAGPRVATTTYDGLARETLSQVQTSSSGPSLYTSASYDNMGRVYTVSNPYYSTGDKTYGITTYYYDALNRKIKQIDSDGTNSQIWGYSGATIAYTDENQNNWQRTTDGLGRLSTVLEPNGASQSASMVTKYGYDALNNLLSVTQLGGSTSTGITRFRSFTYDALSRLLCSSNPENSTGACPSTWPGAYVSGTTGYTYDPNSNLLTKIDARGVTTSYNYDAFNRVLSKGYFGDPTSTLFSCYKYDSTSVTNGIGRLSNAWTQSAACPIPSVAPAAPGTGFWTMRSILAYDQMGRLLSENQYTPSNRSSSPYVLSYSYDLAGNLTSSNNGNSASQMVFTNTFDSAGRLQTLSNTSNPSLPVSLFSLPTTSALPCSNSSTYPYAAFGGLMNANFGAGLTLNRAYDNRLRTTCEIDTGNGVGAATAGSATVTITGSEQSQ